MDTSPAPLRTHLTSPLNLMLVSLDCGKKMGIPDDERELETNPGPSCYEAAELTTAATCHPQSRIFTTVVGAKKSSFEP